MSARKQKLAIEKLKKKVSKTYYIKALGQCNYDLIFNSKVNILAFELAKSSKLALGKEINFTYFFPDLP